MAIHRDFLDPATLPYGTSVTVTGEVTGSSTMPLDEGDYTYPVIDIKNLQVWAGFDDSVPRMRPSYGPGPYRGPIRVLTGAPGPTGEMPPRGHG